MKMHIFIIVMLLCFGAELAVLLAFGTQDMNIFQDAVAVNEVLQSVRRDRESLENHRNETGLDYVVVDGEGNVLFRTAEGLSESVNQAVIHRDTILDLEPGGAAPGKIILYNHSARILQARKQKAILVFVCAMAAQCGIGVLYIVWINRAVARPFRDLKDFARRVAGGNLDIPLEMDRRNLFGAFTESFDLMRTELKRARQVQAQAVAAKKELVAKLSHDIKTPVASIRAASEVGAALTDNERLRDNYAQIIRKADQINTLISNLFTATLEELQVLTVSPADMESGELREMLESSDYLHRAAVPSAPSALVYADRLRLQQVFDNIFANSYKYADSEIDVTMEQEGGSLLICIEDYGHGVSEQEIPLLKEKFRRGSNAAGLEGAGLGLYLSDCFMREMGGALEVQNGEKGLRVTVQIRLSA